MSYIDTDGYSARLRESILNVAERKILIANVGGSDQEPDISEPINCGGTGRVRHFRRETTAGWPANPLPLDPACAYLQLHRTVELRAQVFQNAGCNWRCWYCFVPFSLLSGRTEVGTWLSAHELVANYRSLPNRPAVIDLSGGQPDLVPEWAVWMLEAIQAASLEEDVFLWSDDNLSNDYFFRFLSEQQQLDLANWPGYGRVGCFKGFDAESFAFNTAASPALFDRQFDIFGRLLSTGMDLYAYATFTAENVLGLSTKMGEFVDRLQRLDEALPLRVVPLEITEFGPVLPRLNPNREQAIRNQIQAIEYWTLEIERRFSRSDIETPVNLVPLRRYR